MFKIQVIRSEIGPGMPLTQRGWMTLLGDIESNEKAESLKEMEEQLSPKNVFRIVAQDAPDFEAVA